MAAKAESPSVFVNLYLSDEFWLPKNVSWSSFTDPAAPMPRPEDLLTALLVVPVLLVARWIFLAQIASRVAVFFGLPDNDAVAAAVAKEDSSLPADALVRLAEAFRVNKTSSAPRVRDLAERTGLGLREVAAWFARHRSLERPSVFDKFNCCCLYFCWYSFIFFFGAVYLSDKAWLLDTRHFWIGYPDHPIDAGIRFYYVCSIAFYLSEVVDTRVKRKDHGLMLAHHGVTLGLLVVSWRANHCRIGSVVLVLHDCADVFLNLGKMANYVDADGVCTFAYGGFVLAWIVTRLTFFPLYPVYSVAFECSDYITYVGAFNIWHFCLYLLLALLVMNIYWFYLILISIVDKMNTGKVVDNRSDSDAGLDVDVDVDDAGDADDVDKSGVRLDGEGDRKLFVKDGKSDCNANFLLRQRAPPTKADHLAEESKGGSLERGVGEGDGGNVARN